MHVVTAEEMYEIDRFTMKEIGLPGIVLMENAGREIVRKMVKQIKKDDQIAVLIGTGNNGGDGFVIARYLLSQGYKVGCFLIPKQEKIKGDAHTHMEAFLRAGYEIDHLSDLNKLAQYNVFVDAMLGIGINREVSSPYQEVIEMCNKSEGLKLSVDIPSGISANSNQPFGQAFQASITYTVQCPKLSAFSFPAANYYGKLEIVNIGIPPKAIELPRYKRKLWTRKDVRDSMSERRPDSHKGSYGKGLIIGGSKAMTGAPIMASKAALRSGAGLITSAIPEEVHPVVASHLIEATFSPWDSMNGEFSGEINSDLAAYNGVAIGPGMGRGNGSKTLVSTVLKEFKGTLVIDADGLYHLSDLKDVLRARKSPTILTPHDGEIARLFNMDIKAIQRNRFSLSLDFAQEYGVYLVHKGPFTIVATPDGHQFFNHSGNAALAKGGSGDVLTGILLAFAMQNGNLQEAISNAVYIHGKAAEELTNKDHSLLDVIATDVIEALPKVFRTFYYD